MGAASERIRDTPVIGQLPAKSLKICCLGDSDLKLVAHLAQRVLARYMCSVGYLVKYGQRRGF
jgi:hypothetical protein